MSHVFHQDLTGLLKGLAAAERIIFHPEAELVTDMDELRAALLAVGIGAGARACAKFCEHGVELGEPCRSCAALVRDLVS